MPFSECRLDHWAFLLQKKQYLLAGYLLPLLYAIPVYAIIWLLDFAPFNTSFNCSYFLLLTLGQLMQIIASAGEEIGWRGFLYPQLQKTTSGFNAAFITGIVWAVWHYPLVIYNATKGPPVWYLLFCFTLMIVSLSFITAWLRDKSDSVWPAVLLHASHNFYIQVFLNNLTKPSAIREFVYGEFGIGLSLSTFVLATLLWLKLRQVLKPVTAT